MLASKHGSCARKLGIALAACLGALAGARPAPAAERTPILVYTALEADDLKKYKAAFERDVPDVEIRWVRDSTGVVTAKLLAERDNPQADVVWGLVATSIVELAQSGLIEPYAPKGLEAVGARYRDPADPPRWVGMEALVATVCVNTVEAKKLGLPTPTSWKDLTQPVFKGHVSMPDPSSSGTGLLNVASWLQAFGDEGGWAFMKALDANVSVYTHSGSKPCKDAAIGETALGISFDSRGARLREKGAPIELVFPSEGVGWDIDATALVKGAKHPDAARKLADWAVTRAANEVYAQGYGVVAMPGVAKLPDFEPADLEARLIPNDFDWIGKNRKRILAEWQARFGSKTEREP
ncbi:MAG: putative 2-aminoethylphosphonate ABC transporter substrate-binding protein [bacterium]